MVLILNEQSAWLYPSILTDSLKMDYPFQIACVQPTPPLRKLNRRRAVCGRGRLCTGHSQTDNPFLALVWKRPITKFPVSSVFNDSEGLYRKTVCRCPVHRTHYSARLMRFGSRGPNEFFFSDTPPKCLHRRCVGRRRTGTRHGNVYLRVREKQGIVVYRQRVYKQWHL